MMAWEERREYRGWLPAVYEGEEYVKVNPDVMGGQYDGLGKGTFPKYYLNHVQMIN